MNTLSPIEVTTKRATRVATLTDAWAVVMDSIDKIGDPRPRIEIIPITSWDLSAIDGASGTAVHEFEVVVSGSSEEEA